MAAATDERSRKLLHTSAMRSGHNIFCSGRSQYESPMELLKMPLKWNAEISEVPSPVDELEIEDTTLSTAMSLARDYIHYKLEEEPPSKKAQTDAARTLRRVGDEMIDRHQTVVNAISKRLRYSDLQNDPRFEGYTLDERMFIMIADEISKDSQDNWGRVVSLFVLGAILAQNNRNEQHGRDIERIIYTVGKYVGNHKRKWIEKNGGWDAFVRFFDDGASEKKVWKGLLFAGIGLASLATAVTKQ